MMKTHILMLGLVVVAGGVAQGQDLVLNGDFENTTALGCDFNNTNANFTAKMADATAFGLAEEIDILQTTACSGAYGFAAQSGQYKLGMHRKSSGDMDAIALELSMPVVAGQTYTLSFHVSQLSGIPGGQVEVGLSSSATSFGTLVASGTPLSASAWTGFTESFVAPVNATHLTVRESGFTKSYSFVDNVQLVPAECFLVIGNGPGSSSFMGAAHVFDTQVGPAIEDSYTVLLTDVPEFVLPTPLTSGRFRQPPAGGPGLGGVGGAEAALTAGASPPWMQDQEFSVQVLMWNPQVFPGLPEQFTAGLYVRILPNGALLTEPYGTDVGGMQVSYELDTNAAGQPVIRFPFSLPGIAPGL